MQQGERSGRNGIVVVENDDWRDIIGERDAV
jgi:hypothetical protein